MDWKTVHYLDFAKAFEKIGLPYNHQTAHGFGLWANTNKRYLKFHDQMGNQSMSKRETLKSSPTSQLRKLRELRKKLIS